MRTDYPSNLTYYYQDNHEGSITHLTLANGTVIESYRYDAFGAPTITTTSGYSPNNRFMFTGREYIKGIEIYEYRARTYHPVFGRFMSEDPKGFVHRPQIGVMSNDWSFEKDPEEGAVLPGQLARLHPFESGARGVGASAEQEGTARLWLEQSARIRWATGKSAVALGRARFGGLRLG